MLVGVSGVFFFSVTGVLLFKWQFKCFHFSHFNPELSVLFKRLFHYLQCWHTNGQFSFLHSFNLKLKFHMLSAKTFPLLSALMLQTFSPVYSCECQPFLVSYIICFFLSPPLLSSLSLPVFFCLYFLLFPSLFKNLPLSPLSLQWD